MESEAIIVLVLGGAALLVSILSASFAVLSCRSPDRPIVIDRVTMAKSGNVETSLRLLIENTGNCPTRDVSLACEKADLGGMLAPGVQSQLARRRDLSSQFWRMAGPSCAPFACSLPKISQRGCRVHAW